MNIFNFKRTAFGFFALASAGITLGGFAKTASATPSTLGFYPSTDIYGSKAFHLDLDTYGQGLKANASAATGLTYGTGPDKDGLFGRTEVGADYVLGLFGGSGSSGLGTPDAGAGKRLLFNAKTQLFNNDESGTRVVAGVWGLGDKSIFAPDVAYITGSKTFGFGRIHLGIAHSFAEDTTVATPDGNSDRTNLHLGFDRYFANNKLQLATDYYSGKSGYSGLQPTLYYYVNDKSDFGLGYFRANDKSLAPSRNQIYLCFDYNFGGAAATVNSSAPVPETTPGAPATN